MTAGVEEARREDGEFYGLERLHASVQAALDSGTRPGQHTRVPGRHAA